MASGAIDRRDAVGVGGDRALEGARMRERLTELESAHNASAVVVSETLPLQVQLDGYVEYYESPRGQFTAMLMASPLGAILASTKLTVLAVVCILVMVASTVLSIISPELATELREVQAGAKSRACDIGGKPDGMQSDGVQGGADPAKSSNTNATPILAKPTCTRPSRWTPILVARG